VFIETSVLLKMITFMSAAVPRVAWPETCQKIFLAWAPPARVIMASLCMDQIASHLEDENIIRATSEGQAGIREYRTGFKANLRFPPQSRPEFIFLYVWSLQITRQKHKIRGKVRLSV